jgi:hypothetical protein
MTVLRARRGGTGSKKVSLRGGRRVIPFVLDRTDLSHLPLTDGLLGDFDRRLSQSG